MVGGLTWTPINLLIKIKMVQEREGTRPDLQNTMTEREEIEVIHLNN